MVVDSKNNGISNSKNRVMTPQLIYRILVLISLSTTLVSCGNSQDRESTDEKLNDAVLNEPKGKITLNSSDPELNQAFSWATETALSYVNDGDPVGPWYEAALPQRESFCMRDVSHMSTGAYFLGLDKYNKNMLSKFAANSAPSRNYCSYWEINKEGEPTPVDYASDEDFWYNLPANFDVMYACYRLYQLTGEEDYLTSEPFYSFHFQSVHQYIQQWDSDNDGIMNSPSDKKVERRGIGSYEERIGNIATGADLIGAQAKGYEIFARIMKLQNNSDEAEKYSRLSSKLKTDFDQEWWDSKTNTFYGYKLHDGSYSDKSNGSFILYFDTVDDRNKINATLTQIERTSNNVETNSYVPMIFFKHGKSTLAYRQLLKMADPSVARRTYPEVSYAFIGNVAEGLMGITINAPENTIDTKSNFPESLDWVALKNIPWRDGYVDVSNEGAKRTSITSHSKKAFLWKAYFKGNSKDLWVNGKKLRPERSEDFQGNPMVYAEIKVEPGEQYTVSIDGSDQ